MIDLAEFLGCVSWLQKSSMIGCWYQANRSSSRVGLSQWSQWVCLGGDYAHQQHDGFLPGRWHRLYLPGGRRGGRHNCQTVVMKSMSFKTTETC